jgi:hypothetical protein
MAAPALPLVGMAARRTPNELAIETARHKPRALNEPVGSRPSSFTSGAVNPARRSLWVSSMSGVSISPRVTMCAASGTGSSSRQRHRPGGRASITLRDTSRRSASRS